MKALGLVALLGCGLAPRGTALAGWTNVYWAGDTDAATMACTTWFVPGAVTAGTVWSEAQVRAAMVSAVTDITVDRGLCIPDPTTPGLCDVGLSNEDGAFSVNETLGGSAHEWRHLVAYRLTGNGQADHVDPLTGAPWDPMFEEVYRVNAHAQCGAPLR